MKPHEKGGRYHHLVFSFSRTLSSSPRYSQNTSLQVQLLSVLMIFPCFSMRRLLGKMTTSGSQGALLTLADQKHGVISAMEHILWFSQHGRFSFLTSSATHVSSTSKMHSRTNISTIRPTSTTTISSDSSTRVVCLVSIFSPAYPSSRHSLPSATLHYKISHKQGEILAKNQ